MLIAHSTGPRKLCALNTGHNYLQFNVCSNLINLIRFAFQYTCVIYITQILIFGCPTWCRRRLLERDMSRVRWHMVMRHGQWWLEILERTENRWWGGCFWRTGSVVTTSEVLCRWECSWVELVIGGYIRLEVVILGLAQLRWFGHLERKIGLSAWLWERCVGRGRKAWRECIFDDMKLLGLHHEWAVFRDMWRGFISVQTSNPSGAWKKLMFSK